ncbi:MAG: DNA primase [Paludibacteraceae bacterium]|nr:DNA primase [Paludibacteraceae bacterium]
MIDQLTIDRIMSAAKIEEVVGEYVSLHRRGVNLKGLCPFHSEKTPSFVVSPSKGICKCFGCGKGGNSVNFIMEIEQMNYYEALKFLAKKYGIEVEERELTDEQKAQRSEREALFAVNEFARDYFADILTNNAEGRSVGLTYFRERGINDASIKTFQLGFSLSEKDALTKEALKRGFSKEYLVKTGLTLDNEFGVVDRFRGRVIYPVQTISGKVVAFGGRILKKSDKLAKYVNSPESEIYHKSDQLYGIYQAKQDIVRNDRCYLVEGYMDVISMHQSGIKNVVASSGTSLTTGQIRLIHRFTNNVTVLYDGDAAGIHASIRGIDMLLAEGMNIKVVSLPDGEDPDSYSQTHNSDETIAFLEDNAVDFLKFKTQLLLDDAGNDPIKRAQLIQDIVKSISVIPEAITRAVYVRECSRMMEIEEAMLFNEIDRIRLNKSAQDQKDSERQRLIEQIRERERGASGQPAPTPAPAPKKVANPYFREESDMIKFVIRYGALNLFTDDAGNWISVIEYIKQQLDMDMISFKNSAFQKLFLAAYEHCLSPENRVPYESVFADETSFTKQEDKAAFYANADAELERLSRFLFNNSDY